MRVGMKENLFGTNIKLGRVREGVRKEKRQSPHRPQGYIEWGILSRKEIRKGETNRQRH